MGYKMYDEYTSVLNSNPQFKNSTAIFGGAKIDDKILILQNFIKKVETILIGGGMIKSFINSKDDNYNTAKLILNNGFTKIILPDDILIKSNNKIKTKLIENFSNDDQLFEPSKKMIVKSLIPRHLNFQIWKYLLESYASEQAARMVAMDNATENGQELIKDLTLDFNKARQAAITKEMLEIVGGAEALATN